MIEISNTLVLLETPVPGLWKLGEPLVVSGSVNYVVPKGFLTDLASVPKVVWWLIPPFGKYQRAAVAHDYAYYIHGPDISRVMADAVFLDAMRSLDVAPWKRFVMWLSVRALGWLHFKK